MDYVKLHLLLPRRVCRAAHVGEAELPDAVVDVLASCCLCNKIVSSFFVCLFAAGLGDISVAVRLKPNFNRAVQSAKIIREDCAFVESYVIR